MKSIYSWRLNGYDRMGRAGVHKIGMGVLIGLEEWRTDVIMMARHLRYLQTSTGVRAIVSIFPACAPAKAGSSPMWSSRTVNWLN